MARNRGKAAITAQVSLGTAVLDPDPDRPAGYLLLVDGTQQSYVNLADPTHLEFEYVRRIGHLLDARAPGPVRALHLGGGAMTLARYLATTRPGSRNLVVEADAPLVEFVRANLPWPAGSIRVRVADARATLAALRPATMDVVISDVFAEARNPGNVTTLEYFARAREVLAPGGTFVANLADESPFRYARRFIAGVLATFPEVVAMADAAVWRGRRFGNFVVAGAVADAQCPPGLADPADLANRTRRDPWPARIVAGRELAGFVQGAQPYQDLDAPGSPAPPAGVFGPSW